MNKEAEKRKEYPIYEGFFKYFPRAIRAVSHVSYIGNEQHHPGTPVHWDKSKSQDEPDALLRHMLDEAEGNIFDTDGLMHEEKAAWRAMARLERTLERLENTLCPTCRLPHPIDKLTGYFVPHSPCVKELEKDG